MRIAKISAEVVEQKVLESLRRFTDAGVAMTREYLAAVKESMFG